MSIGVRELKARLSSYVRRAAAGEEIVVTDRGRPVARLVPLSNASNIERGIEEGWVDPPSRTVLGTFDPLRSERATLDVLADDRG